MVVVAATVNKNFKALSDTQCSIMFELLDFQLTSKSYKATLAL